MKRPKILGETPIHETPFLSVSERRWRLGDHEGAHAILTVKRPSAGALPLDADGNVYLVRQYRHGVQTETLEAPGGIIDDGEEPAETAIRETEEELGLKAASARFLFALRPMPSIASHTHHLFLLTDLTETRPIPEPGEDTRVVKIPLEDALQAIDRGEIVEPFTAAALLKAASLR